MSDDICQDTSHAHLTRHTARCCWLAQRGGEPAPQPSAQGDHFADAIKMVSESSHSSPAPEPPTDARERARECARECADRIEGVTGRWREMMTNEFAAIIERAIEADRQARPIPTPDDYALLRTQLAASAEANDTLRERLADECDRADKAERDADYFKGQVATLDVCVVEAERRERELREQLSVIVSAARLEGRPDLAERIAVLASAKERE